MANDRDVRIVLTVDGKQYEAELNKAGKSMRDFGKDGKVAAGDLAQLQGVLKGYAGVAAAGAVVVGIGASVAKLAVESFNAAQASSELAGKLGVTFNQLQGLQLVAENAGVEVESLAKGAVKLSGVFADSLAGKTSASTEALKSLGITSEQLQAVQNDSVGQLALVADGLSKMEAGALRTALAADLLGEKNVGLINILAQGGDVFRQSEEDARRFGLTLDDEAVAAINRADDAVDQLSARLGGLKRQIGAEVAPAIGGLANAVNLFLASVQGQGIRINVEATVNGKPLGAAPQYGLGGALPTAPGSTKDALGSLQVPEGFGSGIVLAGGAESTRRAEAAGKLAQQYQQQLESLEKITAVERARNELLKEKIPLDSEQARRALELAAALDKGRAAQSGGREDDREAAIIRQQQERNRLLQAQLATGVDINAAQAQLLILNTQFEDASNTTLQRELEKGAALESQLATAKELARQNEIVARNSERDREALQRQGQQFGRDTSPRRDRRDAAGFIRDEGLNGARAELDSAYQVTRDDEQQAYREQIAELERYREAGIDIGVDYDERELDLKRQHVANLEAIDRAYQATKDQLRHQDLQVAGDFFGNLATIAQAFGEKGFKAYKAFAIAQTLIETYSNAVKAFGALAPIPFVGPVLGGVAAAAAVAAGLAQVQAIRSQQPPGRQFGGPVAAGGLYEVGERNRPELLENNGRFFLIPGNQGGSVSPAQRATTTSGAGGMTVINNAPGLVLTRRGNELTIDMVPDLLAQFVNAADSKQIDDVRRGRGIGAAVGEKYGVPARQQRSRA